MSHPPSAGTRDDSHVGRGIQPIHYERPMGHRPSRGQCRRWLVGGMGCVCDQFIAPGLI
jgi:hypothetical protein